MFAVFFAGFYIRDGVSIKVTPTGLEKVPGIFISRLVPGGLAESTGILSVNDEVVEVNGIDVTNKSLDQVMLRLIVSSLQEIKSQIRCVEISVDRSFDWLIDWMIY